MLFNWLKNKVYPEETIENKNTTIYFKHQEFSKVGKIRDKFY
jgi:hypothetical protein